MEGKKANADKTIFPSARPKTPPARDAPDTYMRNLPHMQGQGGPLYVTFCTMDRWVLPEQVRGNIIDHCLHDHMSKMHLLAAVVMPDHVPLIYQPLGDDEGNPYYLNEIVGSLKGASAHTINRILNRRGHVWQDESMDHVLRSTESLAEKIEYIRQNPVRKGLCDTPEEYPWLWVNETM